MKAGLAVLVLLALSWGSPAWAADKAETCNCNMQVYSEKDCKGKEEKKKVKWPVGDCTSLMGKSKKALVKDNMYEVFNGQFRDGCTLVHFFTMSQATCDGIKKANGTCCPPAGSELGVNFVSSNTESNCTNVNMGAGITWSVKMDCPQGGSRVVIILCVVGAVLLLVGVVTILSFTCKHKEPTNYVPVPAAPQDDLLKDKGEGGNQYGSVGL